MELKNESMLLTWLAAMTGEAAVTAQTARIPQATVLSSFKCDELAFSSGLSQLAALKNGKHKSFISSMNWKS